MTPRTDRQTHKTHPLLQPGQGGQRRAAVLSVMAALSGLGQAAVVAWALGGLLSGAEVSPMLAVAAFLAAGLIRSGLGLLAEAEAQKAARTVVTAARTALVLREAGQASDHIGSGGLAALAGEKLDVIGPYLIRNAPARARVMVLPPVILALAFWHSWAVGVVLLVAGPLIPLFMALIGLAAKEASARQMAEIGSLNDMLVERLSALVDIRLLGAGAAVLQGFHRQASDLRQRTMAVLRVAFLSSTVLELFAAIGVAMVAVYVGFALLGALEFGAWGGRLSPEAGVFLLLLAPEFFQPLRDLSAAWHDRAAAEAVLDEWSAWEAAAGAPLPGAGGPALRLPGPASVRLASCITQAGRVLPDITIAEGETVALIGGSGAGKTTALRMMAGLWLPVQGAVTVAGQPLSAANADGWRARLGWMPQAPHFLAASLRQNICLGRGGDPWPALRMAAIDAVVAALPQGLATRLGETGGGLSGGEARRITLARAIHGAPDLILADEPTADLDAGTAALIADALLAQAARGATLVVATHDAALAARMGRIIDLGAAT
ncbi:MAG: ATP-binding cassette domain-containing protein [Rhodobacter sp.]|nr:ATP-binding cassette domain-containing protein [Rhodobacter sp.]